MATAHSWAFVPVQQTCRDHDLVHREPFQTSRQSRRNGEIHRRSGALLKEIVAKYCCPGFWQTISCGLIFFLCSQIATTSVLAVKLHTSKCTATIIDCIHVHFRALSANARNLWDTQRISRFCHADSRSFPQIYSYFELDSKFTFLEALFFFFCFFLTV